MLCTNFTSYKELLCEHVFFVDRLYVCVFDFLRDWRRQSFIFEICPFVLRAFYFLVLLILKNVVTAAALSLRLFLEWKLRLYVKFLFLKT